MPIKDSEWNEDGTIKPRRVVLDWNAGLLGGAVAICIFAATTAQEEGAYSTANSLRLIALLIFVGLVIRLWMNDVSIYKDTHNIPERLANVTISVFGLILVSLPFLYILAMVFSN